MKLSLTLSVVLFSFFANPAWAKDEGKETLQMQLCEAMLGHTLKSVNGSDFQFDVMKGLGARGFLGSFPEATAENSKWASAQGVMYWGHGIAVRKSVEEAAEHDAQFNGLSKILYFISDADVSDLTDDSDPDLIRGRFMQIFGNARLIYFHEINGTQILEEVPYDLARRVIHPEMIGFFSKDSRGPRFSQSGWAFPKIRGVLTYKNVFQSGSETVRKKIAQAKALEKKGYTISFSQNFLEALDKARDQVRLEKREDGTLKAIPDGSRYRKSEEYQLALEGYERGNVISVEVRDPSGRLLAGAIGQHHGNLWSFDTVFYDYTSRDGSRVYNAQELAAMPDAREAKSLIDYAKIAALAGLLRLHDHGIDVTDAGMVTKFTAGLKGVYVSAEEFAGYIKELSAKPPIQVDVKSPFSFVSRRE